MQQRKNRHPYITIRRHIYVSIILLIAFVSPLSAQDSLNIQTSLGESMPSKIYQFKVEKLIVPATMIGIGFAGVYNGWMRSCNREIRNDLQKHINSKIKIDDYSRYAPIVALYGLDLCGVKAMHSIGDRTTVAVTSILLMVTSVYTLKHIVREERPDASNKYSFPSGHTAMAFLGAQLLWNEYKDESVWIGLSGYAVATGTGFLRLYNNRHWLTDVVAGAGIGILSAEAAYWLLPFMHHKILKKNKMNVVALPAISNKSVGLSCVVCF
jgi:hypothetical protein